MQERLEELKTRLAEVSDIGRAASILSWDQQTYMPPGGARARGQQLSTLRRIQHEKFTDERIGALLNDLQESAANLPYDSDEASLIRVTRRDYDKQVKVPGRLVAEMAEASAKGFQSWQKAKQEDRYSDFAPYLQKNLELRRELAECLGYTDRIYDPLLDQFEPGITTREVETLFAGVRKELVPLVEAIGERAGLIDDSFLHQPFEETQQWELSLEAAKLIGYSFERGRQDRSAHPFTTTFSVDDVRITTRVLPNYFPGAFFATMHECGHALYNQGTRHELERSPLAGGASLGVHESQSRTWENFVGRSRAFWQFFAPRAQAIFPRQFGAVGSEELYRAVNRVCPSFIRVEADEVTYNLHIMIRLELEIALVENRIAVDDLPEAWNEKMREYLGVTPSNDAVGVLQDVHWSYGTFGYFPTYALGNFLAAQWWDKIEEEIPDIEEGFKRGDFGLLLEWFRTHLHTFGRKFTLQELAVKITGEPLQTRSFTRYLKRKFGDLYGLTAGA